MDWEGVRLLLEVLMIKPKDSKRDRHWLIDSEERKKEDATSNISSNQAEFLKP